VVRVEVLEVFPFPSDGMRIEIAVQFMAGERSKEPDLLGGGAEEETLMVGTSGSTGREWILPYLRLSRLTTGWMRSVVI